LPISKPGRRTSEQPLDRLGLTKAQRIAYLFDFGDEWRVVLTLRRITPDDGGEYRRLLDSAGESPPQIPSTKPTKTPPDERSLRPRSSQRSARHQT